jgi:hypothetical protein
MTRLVCLCSRDVYCLLLQIFRIRLRKTGQCPRALYESAWRCDIYVDGRLLPHAALLAGYTAKNDGVTWRQAAVETARGMQLYELQFKAHVRASDTCVCEC